jgi:hypothetical protein
VHEPDVAIMAVLPVAPTRTLLSKARHRQHQPPCTALDKVDIRIPHIHTRVLLPAHPRGDTNLEGLLLQSTALQGTPPPPLQQHIVL